MQQVALIARHISATRVGHSLIGQRLVPHSGGRELVMVMGGLSTIAIGRTMGVGL